MKIKYKDIENLMVMSKPNGEETLLFASLKPALNVPKGCAIEVTVLYKYDQLPTDEAKEKARDWMRGDDGNWEQWDSDDLTEQFQEHLKDDKWYDVNMSWSLSSCQGDGVSFTGSIGSLDAFDLVRESIEHKYFRTLYTLCRRSLISVECERISNHYSHHNTVQVNVDMYEDYINRDAKHEDFRQEALDRFNELLEDWKDDKCREFEKMGYEQIDYRSSDECVTEDIRANDYDFLVDGSRA
jgi:hypothetical protein